MATATRRKGKIFTPSARKLTRKERDDEVRSFMSICFAILTEQNSFQQISENTGLAYGTVRYLFGGRVSRRTQVGTLQAMGYAAGLKLNMSEHGSKIELVD